jgi:hypothetical protein
MDYLQKTITLAFVFFVTAIAVLIISFGKVTALLAVSLSFISGCLCHFYEIMKAKQSGDQPK